jgi:hypothetical protein
MLAQMRSLIIILDNPPMPRRRALTTAQLDELFALPTELNTLVRYWTLAGTDLEAIHRRRRARNRLGFALQLCALRYPGRLLGPDELIPAEHFASSPTKLTPRRKRSRLTPHAFRHATNNSTLCALTSDLPTSRRSIVEKSWSG